MVAYFISGFRYFTIYKYSEIWQWWKRNYLKIHLKSRFLEKLILIINSSVTLSTAACVILRDSVWKYKIDISAWACMKIYVIHEEFKKHILHLAKHRAPGISIKLCVLIEKLCFFWPSNQTQKICVKVSCKKFEFYIIGTSWKDISTHLSG